MNVTDNFRLLPIRNWAAKTRMIWKKKMTRRQKEYLVGLSCIHRKNVEISSHTINQMLVFLS